MKQHFIASCLFFGLSICQTTTTAPEVDNNAPGVVYGAMLQAGPGPIQGSIIGTSAPDGKGVYFAVSFAGFPSFNESKYTYHIHAKPVASDGNCSSTGAHLDPYHAGSTSSSPSTYKCDPSQPALCELGDLAGKHGSINGTYGSYSASYIDTFLSTTSDSLAFFGNLSVVVHRASDNARLNCGNFTLISANVATSNSSSATSSTVSTAMPTSNYSMSLSTTAGAATSTTTETYASMTADQSQYSSSPTVSIPTTINAATTSKHFDIGIAGVAGILLFIGLM